MHVYLLKIHEFYETVKCEIYAYMYTAHVHYISFYHYATDTNNSK